MRQQMQYVLTFPLLEVIHGFRKHTASSQENVKWFFNKVRIDKNWAAQNKKVLDVKNVGY